MIISLGNIIFGGGSTGGGGGSNAEMEEIQYVISCALNDLNSRLLNDQKQFSDVANRISNVNYALAKTNYNLDKLTDRVMDNEEVTAQALNELKNGSANTTA